MENLKPICLVKARDLDDAWFQTITACVEKGEDEEYKYSQRYRIDRGSYAGQERLELDTVVIDIMHPGTGPLVPVLPQGKEQLAPCTEEQVHQYLTYLMMAEKQPNEQYTYGERLIDPRVCVNFLNSAGRKSQDVYIPLGVNQIEKVIEMYKRDGHGTNQAVMEIAMPSDIKLSDPPCLRLIHARIRDNTLHFFVYFRSWDLVAGFPVNLGGLQLLKAYMAAEIGVKDGSIRAASMGLHIYSHFWDLTALRLDKDVKDIIK